MSLLDTIVCNSCNNKFKENEEILNASGETFHSFCFVCAQCFRPFENGIYYEFEKRKYCKEDFELLFAPYCKACENYINGRVIKAMNHSWHAECFRCESCATGLADIGFIKNANRALCRDCNTQEKMKSTGKIVCNKCFGAIEDDLLRYQGEAYHQYHFSCKSCGGDLNGFAREIKGELYCVRCQDKMDIAICAACRKPIDDERVINALGKQWHADVCISFLGSRHYEKRGLAYCEMDYKSIFGEPCFVCDETITGNDFTAWNKKWCSEHFCCYLCEEPMNQKTKFYDFDLKPICKKCLEKLPSKIRSNILKPIDKESKFTFSWLRKDK